MRELTQEEVRVVSGGFAWKTTRHNPPDDAGHNLYRTAVQTGSTPKVPGGTPTRTHPVEFRHWMRFVGRKISDRATY